MDQGKPEKNTNMQKGNSQTRENHIQENHGKPAIQLKTKTCKKIRWLRTATEEEKEKFSNFPAERFACQESFQFVNFNTW